MWKALALCVIFAVLAVAGCSSTPSALNFPAHSEEASRQAIARMLDDWHDAASQADEARYFGHLRQDAVFLGTDASERWDKVAFQKYAHPHFAKGKAWAFRASRREVVLDAGGSMAHFDEDLVTKNLGPARGSGVVAWAGDRWLIVHYNLTITVPNDRFDAAKDAAGAVLLHNDDTMSVVGFLAGSWVARVPDGERIEEHWTAASDGMLIGTGRTSAQGQTVFFEYLRIEQRGMGKFVYVAQPLGKAPTEFPMVSASASPLEIVFENPEHDWPKRITYRLDKTDTSTKLFVRVEGGPGQPVESWSFERAVVERGRAPALK